jgi:hypothetical protein
LVRYFLILKKPHPSLLQSFNFHNRAQIGGVQLSHLNQLEVEFLFDLKFDFAVHPDDYATFTADLLAFAADRHRLPSEPQHQEPEGRRAASQKSPSQPDGSAGESRATAMLAVAGSDRQSPAAAAAAAAAAGVAAAEASATAVTAAAAAAVAAAVALCRIVSPPLRYKRASSPPLGPAPAVLGRTGGRRCAGQHRGRVYYY